MKRIVLCVTGLLLCGACEEYPDGAVVERERFGGIFSNVRLKMPEFELAEDSVHEYRFKNVSFHRGTAIVSLVTHLPDPVVFETLDTMVTIEIRRVGNKDSLVYRHSAPLNGILYEDKRRKWDSAWDLNRFDWRNPRTHLEGKEIFYAAGFAEVPRSWQTEYRLKIVVAHFGVNNVLDGARAFVRLSSSSK